MRRSFLALTVLVLLVACRKSSVLVHQYYPAGNAGWDTKDTFVYELPCITQTDDYRFSLGLRLHNTFPYEGIWVVAETRLHHPDAVLTDTIYYSSIRPDGMPDGKGVTLQQREQSFASFQLYKGQEGEVRVYHIMTREIIPAVLDVGVKVERE